MWFWRYLLPILIGSLVSTAKAESSPVPPVGITVTVQDISGAVIVGAQVTLASQAGRTVAQGITDNAGNFRLPTVSAGDYTLDVTQAGFREIKQQVRVGMGIRPQIRIVLSVASVKQEVMVSAPDAAAEVSTEISQNQSANAVDRGALDRLPVFDQDYITTMSRFLDSDATGTNGVTLVVNGIEANGPGVTASAIKRVPLRSLSERIWYGKACRLPLLGRSRDASIQVK